jgi:hypothetical protein
MKQVIVRTQKDLDKIKLDLWGEIRIQETKEWININKSYPNAYVYVGNKATINNVCGSATIKYVYGSATI